MLQLLIQTILILVVPQIIILVHLLNQNLMKPMTIPIHLLQLKKMQFQHVLIKYLMNALKQEKVFMFWEGMVFGAGNMLIPTSCMYISL